MLFVKMLMTSQNITFHLFVFQVIKMLFVVVLLFCLCWLPWHLYHCLVLISPGINQWVQFYFFNETIIAFDNFDLWLWLWSIKSSCSSVLESISKVNRIFFIKLLLPLIKGHLLGWYVWRASVTKVLNKLCWGY